MGNSQSIYAYSVTDPRSISLDRLDMIQVFGTTKIWRNVQTGEEYEENTVTSVSSKSVEQEIIIYERRRQQEIGLINVYYVQSVTICQPENTSKKQFRVFTERMLITLPEIDYIPLPSVLYFLQKAFIGFNALFKQIGFFEIEEDFIGINKQHQPKFWFSSFPASNELLNKGALSGNSTHLEGIMVRKIFDLIQSHIREQEKQTYLVERLKITQWTFELATAFINYFVKSQRITIVKKIRYTKKLSHNESYIIPELSRLQFSLKDPNYTIAVNFSQAVFTPPAQSSKKETLTSRNMFDSVHWKCGSYFHLNTKNTEELISPRSSIGNRSSMGLSGLNFKQTSTHKNESIRNGLSASKSICSDRRNSVSANMNFSQRKLKLQEKIIALKSTKELSEKSPAIGKKLQSFISKAAVNANKDSQISSRKQSIPTHKKLQVQSTSSSQIHQFKVKAPNEKALHVQNHKSKTHLSQINFVNEETTYSSTAESNLFRSPQTKSKIQKNRDDQGQLRTNLVFSQQISYKHIAEEITRKASNTTSPLLTNNNRQVKKSTDNQMIFNFIDKKQQQDSKNSLLSQSIMLDEPMVQSRNNDRSLGMLDKLMMKKAIQKIEGQMGLQQSDMKNPNLLARSIIQPFEGSSQT